MQDDELDGLEGTEKTAAYYAKEELIAASHKARRHGVLLPIIFMVFAALMIWKTELDRGTGVILFVGALGLGALASEILAIKAMLFEIALRDLIRAGEPPLDPEVREIERKLFDKRRWWWPFG